MSIGYVVTHPTRGTHAFVCEACQRVNAPAVCRCLHRAMSKGRELGPAHVVSRGGRVLAIGDASEVWREMRAGSRQRRQAKTRAQHAAA